MMKFALTAIFNSRVSYMKTDFFPESVIGVVIKKPLINIISALFMSLSKKRVIDTKYFLDYIVNMLCCVYDDSKYCIYDLIYIKK